MSDTALYYRHSGRFSPVSLLITAAVGVIGAMVLGFAYGVIVFYMPIVYINALLTVGLGAGLGVLVRTIAMSMSVRNVPVVLLVAIITGLVAEYAAFVGWVAAVAQWNVVIINPGTLMPVLEALAEQGVWSMKGSTVKGAFLVGIWIIEGLVIIGTTLYFARDVLHRTPYCESCNRWLRDVSLVGPFKPVADGASLRTSLEQGDFAALGEVKPLDAEEPNDYFAEYELINCPSCDEMAVVTIRNVRLVVDGEGKLTRTVTPIVNQLKIDRTSSDLIKELGPGNEPAAAAAAEQALNDEAQFNDDLALDDDVQERPKA